MKPDDESPLYLLTGICLAALLLAWVMLNAGIRP